MFTKFFEIYEKRGDSAIKNRKTLLKSRLFKFKSHPHGVFGVWHLFCQYNMCYIDKIDAHLKKSIKSRFLAL